MRRDRRRRDGAFVNHQVADHSHRVQICCDVLGEDIAGVDELLDHVEERLDSGFREPFAVKPGDHFFKDAAGFGEGKRRVRAMDFDRFAHFGAGVGGAESR